MIHRRASFPLLRCVRAYRAQDLKGQTHRTLTYLVARDAKTEDQASQRPLGSQTCGGIGNGLPFDSHGLQHRARHPVQASRSSAHGSTWTDRLRLVVAAARFLHANARSLCLCATCARASIANPPPPPPSHKNHRTYDLLRLMGTLECGGGLGAGEK